MIKQGIINYFRNLKYVLTPFAFLFLGIVLGLSIWASTVPYLLTSLATDINGVVPGLNLTPVLLIDNIFTAAGGFDIQSIINVLSNTREQEWVVSFITSNLKEHVEEYTTYEESITALVQAAAYNISSINRVLFFFVNGGFVVGFYVLSIQIRINIANRALWKFFLEITFNVVATYTIFALYNYLMNLLQVPIYFSLPIFFILVVSLSLILAYFMHGFKKIPFFHVFNMVNILKLLLTNAIIFVITVAISLLLMLISYLAGMALAVALFEIAFLVCTMNGENYVQRQVKNLSITKISVDENDEGYKKLQSYFPIPEEKDE